jgi:hypothetical protein
VDVTSAATGFEWRNRAGMLPYANDAPPVAGEIFRRPDLAATLRKS